MTNTLRIAESGPPSRALFERGIFGDLGHFGPITWASASEAERLVRHVLAKGYGEVLKNPHLKHTWAADLVRGGALSRVVAEILGPDVAVENSFLITKEPGTDFAVPLHQDGTNAAIELDPEKSVALWLALTEATVTNGCLQVVQGSHKAGYLDFERSATQAPGGARPLSAKVPRGGAEETIPIPMDAGQGWALNVCVLHSSPPNRSSGPRVGLNIRYVAPGGFTRLADPDRELMTITGDQVRAGDYRAARSQI
jgi:Phytanoyl-CoA dioxygenase (PhyH)